MVRRLNEDWWSSWNVVQRHRGLFFRVPLVGNLFLVLLCLFLEPAGSQRPYNVPAGLHRTEPKELADWWFETRTLCMETGLGAQGSLSLLSIQH